MELFQNNLQIYFSQIQYVNVRESDWMSLLIKQKTGKHFSVINKVDKWEASFVAIYQQIKLKVLKARMFLFLRFPVAVYNSGKMTHFFLETIKNIKDVKDKLLKIEGSEAV
jgi:hypothetical protein